MTVALKENESVARSSIMGGVVATTIGLSFATAGYVVAFYVGWPIVENAQASQNWPVASGAVTDSRVTTSQSDESTLYRAEVLYSYEVDGREYSSDVVWFGGNSSTSRRSGPAETVARYPVGAEVKVHYNPADPAVAVLEPGAYFSTYSLFGTGLLCLTIGILLLFWIVKNALQRKLIFRYAALDAEESYDDVESAPVDPDAGFGEDG
ncbi:MAG: DUF3592 domain-containing protein [Planctomycetota bacterium]|nr:MAG: DUF3592 domain-containing protein [Planctomycetota bacterium]REK20467.1 MAG: DUF3592 domain-containing protein [Planctomycetota bacterium]REK33869.1 MAG: DUF3592 domain-containing protein [Planctomycetota bacterium]